MSRKSGAEQVNSMVRLRGRILDDQTLLNEHPPKMESFFEKRL